MASVNKCIIVGNLGADPEVRTFQNGGKIANISVATTERWTDKNTGEQREATEWHRITFNDRLAEIAAQYLKKGSSVYVEGSLRTRKWQDPQTGQDRYTTEIRGISMQMLGGGNGNPAQVPQGNYPQNGYGQAPQGQGQYQAPPQGYGQGQVGQKSRTNPVTPPPQQAQYYATYPDGTPIFPPQPLGQNPQGKAVTPPTGVADDDMPF